MTSRILLKQRVPVEYVRLRVEVHDTGVGIPPEAMPLMFERFNRCKGYRNEHMAKGTGLGLSVTKQVVSLLKVSVLCIYTIDIFNNSICIRLYAHA